MFAVSNLPWSCFGRVLQNETQAVALPKPRMAAQKMHLVLQEATHARQRSLELEQHEYAGQLSQDLLNYAATMEKQYRALSKKVEQKEDSERAYSRIFEELDQRQKWFEKAEAGQRGSNSLSSHST